MAFELPPLPYGYVALEPYIDTQTMQLHHDKHHATYVNTLNKAIEGNAKLSQMSIEQILEHLEDVPENIRTVVRNNGGGHANHSMFWRLLKPGGGSTLKEGELSRLLSRDYG